jgi:hypothetical protein
MGSFCISILREHYPSGLHSSSIQSKEARQVTTPIACRSGVLIFQTVASTLCCRHILRCWPPPPLHLDCLMTCRFSR